MRRFPSFLLASLCILCAVWLSLQSSHRIMLSFALPYSADVISIDNFYDAAQKVFTGEQRSVTTYSFEKTAQSNDVWSIQNVMDVRSAQGEPIFTVKRVYGIDPSSGMHASGFGDSDREGYLWGPVGNVPFYTYWHANYNAPAPMKLIGTEMLWGLRVHHYAADYQADQTENLRHLSRVQQGEGVAVQVHLETWIEPTTGYLVQYADHSSAWYYDRETGKRTDPWNVFRNEYSVQSSQTHVRLANHLKILVVSIRWILPMLFLLLAFICIALPSLTHRRGMRILLLMAASFFLILTTGAWAWVRIPVVQPRVIAILPWATSDEYESNIAGFQHALALAGFREGKEVIYMVKNAESSAENQKKFMEDLQKTPVDLVYSLTAMGTQIVKQYAGDVPVVFSAINYPVEAGIVRSLHRSGENLVGTRNWIPEEDQIAMFLTLVPQAHTIAFAHKRSTSSLSVQFNKFLAQAEKYGLKLIDVPANTPEELHIALEALGPVDAVYSACDILIQFGGAKEVISFVEKRGIPDFSCLITGMHKGSLMGLVVDFREIGELAGQAAAQVLSGIPPSVLDTQTSQKPVLILNEHRAQELHLAIPQILRARANIIIR